ncbi:S41 family peptidase [Paracandidimonas soli]|uniref:S41 family peptidase n=1 Tax=Paracandidimonas soli TaxID=1917182 RepID=UPI0033426E23
MGTRRVRSLGLVALGAVGGILLSLGITAAAQRGEPLPLKELQQFANVFAAIKSSYVEPLTDEKLINDAIKGLFSDLDPHSSYLDADAFKEMETLTQGGFGGLGIELGTEDDMPKVIAPIEDTPAARAGILAGDIITHIDDKPTKGMTLNGAIKLMRGEPNTPIVLTIRRQTSDKPLTFHIVRDMIKVRSVRSKMLSGDIGYVRISQFQDRTVSDLAKHLYDLNSGGKKPKALILDLRNDPGGLFDGAIGVSSMFLEPKTLVVSTKGRVPSANREYMSRSVRPLHNEVASTQAVAEVVSRWARSVPMVVLVNVGSASSSEIVAGALQDHKRATIIGNRTFGKGSVQSVLPLSEDTGIKITTARYYTPNGRSIQVTGVEPDIVVDDTAKGNLFRLPREGDLTRHLMNGAEDEGLMGADPEELIAAEFEMFEFGGEGDYQLEQAINHLEGRAVLRRDPEAARLAQEAADKAKRAEAEKKSPVKNPEQETTRYRITPDGIVKAK